MTPTEAAIVRLSTIPEELASKKGYAYCRTDDIQILLDLHDRHKRALIRACEYIEKVHTVMPTSLHKAEAMGECAYLARVIEGKDQEALRCD